MATKTIHDYDFRAMLRANILDHAVHDDWWKGMSLEDLRSKYGVSTSQLWSRIVRHKNRFNLMPKERCIHVHPSPDPEGPN